MPAQRAIPSRLCPRISSLPHTCNVLLCHYPICWGRRGASGDLMRHLLFCLIPSDLSEACLPSDKYQIESPAAIQLYEHQDRSSFSLSSPSARPRYLEPLICSIP